LSRIIANISQFLKVLCAYTFAITGHFCCFAYNPNHASEDYRKTKGATMAEALIWGASGGIGATLAQRLKADGFRVYGAARSPERLPADLDLGLAFDAADPKSIDQAVLSIAQVSDGIDLVVYAAGDLNAMSVKDISLEAWDEVINSNLTGAMLTSAASLNLIKDGGLMVFIGAYTDHVILPKMGAYAAAKAGLEVLVKVLARENRKLRFTLLRPGAVDTPFWENAPFRLPKNAKPPEEVVDAIVSHYQQGHSGALDL
jgi:3-oxoacyl-[acyl-carrier protein] reductase